MCWSSPISRTARQENYTRDLCDVYFARSEDGIDVLRCFSTFSQESSLISRFLENISFGLFSGIVVFIAKKPDVIYANTWPIFAAGILSIVAFLRGIPLVTSIQDLYPESLMVQGRFTKLTERHPIIRLLRFLDTWVARNSQAVIVISERFARIYCQDRGIRADKIKVVRNWGDEKELTAGGPENDIRRNYSIPKQDLLLVYGGNVGVAASVETVIRAMGLLPKDVGVKLLIAGEGSQLNNCQDLALRIGKEKIVFYTPWPVEETASVLRAADILVLPTKGKQCIVSIPSKLISYLFAAKPILALANDDAEIARLICQAGCGWVVEPESPQKVADMILKIHRLSRQELDYMGLSGRMYALEHYSRPSNVRRVLDTFFEVATYKRVSN
jgi:colanic acid biosynthesis glycosyl transferase WcaI